MAQFKFGRPVSLRWNGLLVEGPAETVFEIPDEYYEEFNEDIGGVEPTLVWLDSDEGATVRARVTALELASTSFAILDAKGDLISATADNTAARLGVGTDGKVLTADSSTATGLAWATNIANSAFGLKEYVKNTSGVTIAKGRAVYITGATGTNVTVGLADYDTDATSSKTIGLMETTVAHNGFGYVVTEGILTGFDTTGAATEGVAIWLGASGSLIYGSPPSEPYHTVYLGVVSRKNVSNGEVFVKVQNGYELTELHDVSAAAPADNDILQFDNASGYWKNETLSNAGIATSGHTHAIYLTDADGDAQYSQLAHTHTSFANNLQINKADSKVQLLNTTSGSGTEDGMYLLMADTDVGYLWNAETNGALVLGTGGAERVRITSAGKFGIGTNAPSHQLEVVGPSSVTVGLSAGGSGFAELELVGQAGKNYITSDDTLSFDIGGTERATVATTGLDVTSGTLSQGGTAVSLSGHTHGALMPTGSIAMWPTATAPTGWLFLNGATYNQSTYPDLAAVFGVVSGTFTLPDMRDRFAAGLSTVGALSNNAGTFAPNTANATAHDHTTNIAHGHSNTIAVSSHASHTHSVDPASFTSGSASVAGAGQSGSGISYATGGHTHAIDVPATTSGGPSSTLSHSVSGGVTSLGATSITSSSAGGTLTPKATLLNFIIKT
jgi:hypothetical protein